MVKLARQWPILFAVLGCYMSGHPGAGIGQSFAKQWGCEQSAVRAIADSARGITQRQRVPQKGWSVCQVMGSIGYPDNTDVERSGGETTAKWTYRACAGCMVKSVILVRAGDLWTVDAATTWY